MRRLCYPCALLLALPHFSQGQQPANETVIKLNVQAMAAPKPALRYLLLPDLREMNPGNPVVEFMRSVLSAQPLFTKEESKKWDKWDEAALKDLPVNELRKYGEEAVSHAHFAARLDAPDWQALQKFKQDGAFALFPDVAKMHQLSVLLTRRLRLELADGRMDNAVHTAQTLFALARILGEHPTLIGDLVAIAVASRAAERLEEMVQQPSCPNLFWALTDLPHPFIDLRKGIQGERAWDVSIFDKLEENRSMSEVQLQDVLAPLQRLFKAAYRKEKSQEEPAWPAQWLAARTKDQGYLQAARKRLIESGRPESIVKQFPDLQVLLLDGKLRYDTARDESMKGASLPYWQAAPLVADLPKVKDDPFLGMVPASDKALMARTRLDQRLALLRCVEALRIYAAEHNGKLPAQLADSKLPLPVDPVTGKDFQYRLEGGTAHLRGSPPAGMEKQAPYNLRYEVTIRR